MENDPGLYFWKLMSVLANPGRSAIFIRSALLDLSETHPSTGSFRSGFTTTNISPLGGDQRFKSPIPATDF